MSGSKVERPPPPANPAQSPERGERSNPQSALFRILAPLAFASNVEQRRSGRRSLIGGSK